MIATTLKFAIRKLKLYLTLSVIESKLLVASSKIKIGEFFRIARAIAYEKS